jgi:tRNA(fMet)-specific endonuclease VapC
METNSQQRRGDRRGNAEFSFFSALSLRTLRLGGERAFRYSSIGYSSSLSITFSPLPIARSNNAQQEIVVYKRLRALLSFFNEITVLDYDEEAAVQFDRLRRSKLRVATMDLKIAATAISKDALLLSANLKDFQKIPDLRVENWTQ